jgi:AcrR family transcriptional regulator
MKGGRKQAASPRRSQAERREATRKRILEATLDCLAKYGYAGTGLSQVLAHARVSRGAWAHHFPSVHAMILEAAQHLMARVYERLGGVLREVGEAKDGLRGLILVAWREFFASEVNQIYLELLIASRRDTKLAAMLGSMSESLERSLGGATGGHFETLPGSATQVMEIMHLNRWVLRGIALDAPLMNKRDLDRALDAWCRLAATQVRMRGEKSPVLRRRSR